MQRYVWIVRGCIILFVFLAVVFVCQHHNILCYMAQNYEMQGIDVSHYQGVIDWKEIEAQQIDFAYIKATEGTFSVDENFEENWREARETSMYVGAYHFFSFDSDGKSQGEHYIQTVGDLQGCLYPVIDVEYYGDKEKNPPSMKEVKKQLEVMLEMLEREYGKKPVIYTTYKVYHKYIGEYFNDYPLWIRNVYYPPLFGGQGEWVFWQYSDTDSMSGYLGEEKSIDRDVFRGSEKELRKYLIR